MSSFANRQRMAALPIDYVVKPYLLGASAEVIANAWGISTGSVYKLLRSAGVKLRRSRACYGSRISIPVDELKRLYADGKTLQQIGKIYNVSTTTVGKYLKEAGVLLRKRGVGSIELNLSSAQKERFIEFVDGILLGDGSLLPNGALRLGQANKRIGWLQQLQKVFDNFGCKTRISSAIKENRDKKIRGITINTSDASALYVGVCDELIVQRARWYDDAGKKRVPLDVRITPISIAHWVAGDGCGDRLGHLIFCTNSFTQEEVERLANRLPVEAHARPIARRDAQYTINITKRNEALKLAKMIRKHMPECCHYKLRFVRPAQPVGGPNKKLTLAQVRQMFELSAVGWSKNQLAERFKVCSATVWNVLSGTYYRKFGIFDEYQKRKLASVST